MREPDTEKMSQFLDALSFTPNADDAFSQRLQRALAQAEEALLQAKMALAAGDTEAANAALDEAGEAHTLAQSLRQTRPRRNAA